MALFVFLLLYICFNSSQVGWKPPLPPHLPLKVVGFNSSQVGWKPRYFFDGQNRWQVSIPHRQAGNASTTNARINTIRFQFLIGRLETPASALPGSSGRCFNSSQVGWKLIFYCLFNVFYTSFNSSQVGWKRATDMLPCCAHTRFQFLIGRLETIQAHTSAYKHTQFQFLIGRLETLFTLIFFSPHSLFQFLIGRLETEIPMPDYREKLRFNSSQVGWKLSSIALWYNLVASVSIPHRQAGNGLVLRRRISLRLFQFLIGRLETA